MNWTKALVIAVVLTGSAWAQSTQAPVVFAVDPVGHVAGSVKLIPGPKGDPGTNGINGTNGTDGTNGIDGKDGATATVTIGTVTTGAPGTSVSVTNSGTPNAAVLNFTIPKGDTGVPGIPGPPGPPTPYPGVTSNGANGLTIAGKVTAKEVDTNGLPPNGLTIGGAQGFTGTITPFKSTCRITVIGGVITGATGC